MLALCLSLSLFQGRAAELNLAPARQATAHSLYFSPAALAATPDGRQLFIACATAGRVLVFDTLTQQVSRSITVPESPLGLVLSPDGRRLLVTCAAPRSTVCVLDTATLKVVAKIQTGHTAMAPVCAPDGKTLYVCDRFQDCIAVIDLDSKCEVGRIPVPREPVAAALTPDGKTLFVANHLHTGRADAPEVGACVSIIDTAARKVVKHIQLPTGSTVLRDLRLSPDGQYACVTHVLARFHVPTTQIERGWIDNNALSLIDVRRQSLLGTVLLDTINSGAANPWGAAWTADGKKLCIAHAGTHELSVIDAPGLLAKLETNAASATSDLSFLVGLRERIPLHQKGPRSLAILGNKVYLGNYFSDSLSVVDLSAASLVARTVPLGPPQPLSVVRKGELAFNDATLCFQGWQSCGSCHSSDGRVDGLNWDLLNDGIGNPKNVKSLLFAHRTPPSMSLGVRANARLAVRAGFRFILFTVPDEDIANAVDTYLESLKPIPSPRLEQGKLSAAAQRGRKLFQDPIVGCATCHNSKLYTDLKPYNVGTGGAFDKPQDKFFTPHLIEVWRTAPYLHDGSAATLREVLTTRNPGDQHGTTSHLTAQQIEDLAEFVLSL
jgi:YVTN family beta-propeller protein